MWVFEATDLLPLLSAASNVVSAGTFVASVLEHFGYIHQAQFLQEFKEFFRDAGALVYLIAGAGAVLSVAMYGSFRAARYLVIGPALFWFLVGPTTSVPGVLWKVGGGDYLGQGKQTGESAATEYRNKVLKELGADSDGNINGANGFWLFAYPINQFVNEFVDIILKSENEADKLVISKTRGLEIMFHELPKTSPLIDIIEQSLMSQCVEMFTAAAASANAYLRQSIQDSASGTTTSSGSQAALRASLLEKVNEAGKTRVPVTATDSALAAWIKEHADSKTVSGNSIAAELQDAQSVKCSTVWEIVAEELWHAAKGEYHRLLIGIMQDAPQKLEDKLCRALEKKLFDGNSEGNCEDSVTAGLALSMLGNQVKRNDTYGRILKRHWNQRDLINPDRSTIITGPPVPDTYELVLDSNGNAVSQWSSKGNVPVQELKYQERAATGAPPRTLWSPMITISDVHGMDYAMWVSTARFNTVILRQQIFTWAMQMPYYQGVLLYLIAIAYPFFAIIVILPGKAVNILNLPLAWLCVKSWDIGFAAVMILDKVIYNLFPTIGLPSALRNGPWYSLDLFPVVLSEAFKVDPSSNVHLYYALLAMVMMSIPVISGAITLKARRGIFASWTDKIADQAKDAGQRVGGAYNIVQSNERLRMNKQIRGAALRTAALGSNRPDSGTKGVSASWWGSVATVAEALKSDSGKGLLEVGTGAVMKGAETARDIAKKEAEYEGELRKLFDPVLGRWGWLEMLNASMHASIDGGGGYEIEAREATVRAKAQELFKAKLGVCLDLETALAAKSATELANPGFKDGKFDIKKSGMLNVVATIGTLSTVPEVARTLSGAGAEKDKDRQNMWAFQHIFDGGGYSQEELVSATFNISPDMARKYAADPNMNKNYFVRQFFETLGSVPPGGGMQTYLFQKIQSGGGDRRVEGTDDEGWREQLRSKAEPVMENIYSYDPKNLNADNSHFQIKDAPSDSTKENERDRQKASEDRIKDWNERRRLSVPFTGAPARRPE